MTHRYRSMRNWTAVMIIVACCFATRTNGSAIPMWEFLAKEEKVSYFESSRKSNEKCQMLARADSNQFKRISSIFQVYINKLNQL